MNEPANYPKVGIGVFVWKDGKFIMGQRLGAHGANTWSISGGKLDYGEGWEDCAKREVREETGLEITNVRFLAATNDLFLSDNMHYTTIWMESDWLAGEPAILEPDKLIKLDWRTFQTLPSPLFEPCWQNLRAAKPTLFAI